MDKDTCRYCKASLNEYNRSIYTSMYGMHHEHESRIYLCSKCFAEQAVRDHETYLKYHSPGASCPICGIVQPTRKQSAKLGIFDKENIAK